MDAASMRSWFDVLQDKTGSPWFDSDEKDEYLTDAMWDIINDSIDNLEEDSENIERISTLIRRSIITTTTDSDGYVVVSKTGTGFEDFAGTAAAAPIYVLTVVAENGTPVSPVKHHQVNKWADNTYRAGNSSEPLYTNLADAYAFYGVNTASDLDFTYIAQPTTFTNLPERMHRMQVAKAMEKTGYTTENEALIMMGANEDK